jgi:WD40 repeat protein
VIGTGSRELDRVFARTEAVVTDLAYSPHGQTLATVGYRWALGTAARIVSEITMWRPNDGESDWWAEALQPLKSVAFSPDGKWIATCACGPSDSTIVIRNARDGRIRSYRTVKGNSRGQVAFSPDGEMLAVCSGEQLIILDSETLGEQEQLWPLPTKAARKGERSARER